MPAAVKPGLRTFDYMRWAQTVPHGARYDLTASGMSDAVVSDPGLLPEALSSEQLCRRDQRRRVADEYIEAVAAHYGVSPECVTPSLGASLAITHVLMALVRTGDHVIVERPTYEALHRVPELLGANVSRLERTFDEDWNVVPERLARLLTPRTRAVILSNLHNPSGVGLRPSTLEAVGDLAARVGALVLIDEVYLEFVGAAGNQEYPSAALHLPNAVIWSSLTKCYGFAALRAGFIVTRHAEAARAVRAATDYLHVDVPSSTLILGRHVLEHAPRLLERARTVASAGRRAMERWIESEPRVTWVPPAGGLTALVRLPDFLAESALTDHLRERYDTQVVPGHLFGAPGHVRVSYGIETKQLEQALANVSAALDDLA